MDSEIPSERRRFCQKDKYYVNGSSKNSKWNLYRKHMKSTVKLPKNFPSPKCEWHDSCKCIHRRFPMGNSRKKFPSDWVPNRIYQKRRFEWEAEF